MTLPKEIAEKLSVSESEHIGFYEVKGEIVVRKIEWDHFFGNSSTINTAGKQIIYDVANMEIEKWFILKTSFQAIKIRAITWDNIYSLYLE